MARKAKLKDDSEEEKTSHYKELSSLKKLLRDYKVERKANWKSFKSKIKDSIGKLEKSVDRPSTPARKQKENK
jgi:hypothetical protein